MAPSPHGSTPGERGFDGGRTLGVEDRGEETVPAETHSVGPARSYEAVKETVRQAVERYLAERRGVGTGDADADVSAGGVLDDVELAELGLDDLDLAELVEIVAEETAERGIAEVDELELMECKTVGDLVELLASATSPAPASGGPHDDRGGPAGR